MSGPIFDLQFADLFATTLTLLLSVYPIWLPILLIVVFWNLWLDYIRTEYISEQQFVLLEIKLPKEITKSPAAMEIFYTALYQTGSATFFETYWSLNGRETSSHPKIILLCQNRSIPLPFSRT